MLQHTHLHCGNRKHSSPWPDCASRCSLLDRVADGNSDEEREACADHSILGGSDLLASSVKHCSSCLSRYQQGLQCWLAIDHEITPGTTERRATALQSLQRPPSTYTYIVLQRLSDWLDWLSAAVLSFKRIFHQLQFARCIWVAMSSLVIEKCWSFLSSRAGKVCQWVNSCFSSISCTKESMVSVLCPGFVGRVT